MTQDAGAKLLIAQPEFRELLSEYDGEAVLTSELDDIPSLPVPDVKVSPSDLAIMLYTSGSTGKPKGVQIEHGNIVCFASGTANFRKAGVPVDYYSEDCVAAAYASFGFDVCMMDIFCTLLGGGTLVVIPEELRLELGALADYMQQEKVTQIFMTTQVGVQFLQNFPDIKHLRYVAMGGEKLPAVDPSGLSYTIINGYGPTENTCGVSLFPIARWEKNIPLGHPAPTIQGYILDKSGHRLPPGACGEYCVAGGQVSRGYLGLPEKTAQVYEDCPFYEGIRMYHTGDVVRYRENGDVEFVGRKDGMVKIRGFRIELGEVESAIKQFEGIKGCTVQAYDYDGGGKYLAAFVVSESKVDVEALTQFVKASKPPYMVPAVIMQIDSIPLTVNQKVDKKALPRPQMKAASFVAPKGKVEQDFCEIFAEVLGQEKVSAAADFFEIGGSSIIALKVVVSAGKRGYSIVYNDIFSYPTAQDIAAYISQNQGDASVEEAEADVADTPAAQCDSFYGPNTTEIGSDGFDYSAINALLRGNTLENFLGGERRELGDVLLVGATGFLGIHVLKDLISNYDCRIYCFIRGKGGVDATTRLQHQLYYFFDDSFKELFGRRIFIVEGDATDKEFVRSVDAHVSTVVNCAACVKHFSKGNEIELINVESVRNLVMWCLAHNAALVHVSTGSVMGSAVGDVPPKGLQFNEHVLYWGQSIDGNQYIHSKFMAERLIYEAILHHGLSAKVVRVGNLAPRNTDGEFQMNFKTNNFMATIGAYEALGMILYEALDAQSEFSPIDFVARSILLLATTPKECVCFMSSNQHRVLIGDIVRVVGSLASPIRPVESEEFASAVQSALSDPLKVDKMRPLIAYNSGNGKERLLGVDDLNVEYTSQLLYRLGFHWPETGVDYITKFVKTISGFNFFD